MTETRAWTPSEADDEDVVVELACGEREIATGFANLDPSSWTFWPAPARWSFQPAKEAAERSS